MEISSMNALSDFAMEGSSLMHQWQVSPTDEFSILPITPSFGQSLQHHTNSLADAERPTKQIRHDTWNLQTADSTQAGIIRDSVCPVLSFNHNTGNLKPKEEQHFPSTVFAPHPNQNYAFDAKKSNSNATRGLSQAQDHIIAERKRREKLSQRFIALSSIIPGLKKMDKASVLGDAIKYLKHLQERVKVLEEQTRKKTIESVVFVRKSQLYFDDDDCPAIKGTCDEALPEIEVRLCDKNILIRIHCEKRKGVLEKTMAEVEKLRLIVINSNVMSFGASALDLTIIAQMSVEFDMGVKDVVKNLRRALELGVNGNRI